MDTDRSEMTTPSGGFSYRKDLVLGERGGEGEVFRGRCEKSRKVVAVKVFHWQLASRTPELTPDVLIRQELDSSGRLDDALELMVLPLAWERDATQQVLVLPLMPHGDLLEDTIKRHRSGKVMSEDDARRLAGRLLRGASLLHDHGWGHMDIKLENVLLRDGDAYLADFGHAKHTAAQGVARTPRVWPKLGIINFMAPEVFRQRRVLPQQCDVWAIGACVLAVLVASGVNVRQPSLVFPPGAVRLSPGCLDFLARSMEFNPLDRATVDQLLSHPWLAGCPAVGPSSPGASSFASAPGAWGVAPATSAGPASCSTTSAGADAAAAAASRMPAAAVICSMSDGTASTEDSDVE